MKERLIKEFNKLGIPDMDEVKELYDGKGSFVNLDFPLPSGLTVRFWDDDKTYFIAQLEKKGSERCYGLTLTRIFYWFVSTVILDPIPKSLYLSVGID